MTNTELHLLSAGAVKPGLIKVIASFEREQKIRVHVSFATAPEILERFSAGEAADIVVAPAEALDRIEGSSRKIENRTSLGRIGVGVFVRSGVPAPAIATAEELKESLLAADSVVYNRASTGAYLEKLFGSLGIAEMIAGKTVRYPDFGAVLEHIRSGADREIGFGATTVIVENQSRGVTFAGALPSNIQNYTSYFAAALTAAGPEDPAGRFLIYLTGEEARTLLRGAGIQ